MALTDEVKMTKKPSKMENNSNPFFIEGPACINTSGGRTSAYMLRQIQLAGSMEDPSVIAVFADTGKEREETYEFLKNITDHFGIPIHYVAYGYTPTMERRCFPKGETPFELMIKKERYLPNPTQRICTDRMKIKHIHRYMKFVRLHKYYRKVIGLRADEKTRVANFRNAPDASRIYLPLNSAGADKQAVIARRRSQPFDLQLKDWEGNCDLCFLKGMNKRKRIMRDRPDLAEWWIEREREMNHSFRAHSPSYEKLYQITKRQPELFDTSLSDEELEKGDIDDLNDCYCTF